MTNATLRGKPDAGNPHVRFDEGEVASAKPRRESLLYKDSIRKWLTEQFGADEELFAELYGQYAADMKSMATELPALVERRDMASVGEKAHAMKGMALQIGDSELSEPCLRLQNASRAGNLADCASLVPTIVALVAAL